jgi:crossover junction endodeoxyribonuclease RuvC
MSRPVYGLDLSLTGTAIAGPDGTHRIYTRIYTPGHNSDPLADRADRIDQILDWVAATIPTPTLGPPVPRSLVVVEAPSYGSTGGKAHERAGLWWAAVGWLLRCQTEVVDIAPGTLKKFATGSGTATKPDMRMAMYKRAGTDEPDDNQVDAWWLRQLGLYLIGESKLGLPQANTANLDKLVATGKVRFAA